METFCTILLVAAAIGIAPVIMFIAFFGAVYVLAQTVEALSDK